MHFVNCRLNKLATHPEYKRIILKLFPNLKALDKENLHLHSEKQTAGFHHAFDMVNFSFS